MRIAIHARVRADGIEDYEHAHAVIPATFPVVWQL